MDNISFNENELKFGVRKIRFRQNIRTVETIGNTVVVLLSVPYEDNNTLDNIYAFDLFGEKLWKIQPISEKFPNLGTYLPYENLMYNNDKLSASDFMGRRFYIDIKKGLLTDMEIVK